MPRSKLPVKVFSIIKPGALKRVIMGEWVRWFTLEGKNMIADIKTLMETRMDQSIAAFKNNLQRIRTSRPSPALLDTIHVDYYGSGAAEPSGQRAAAHSPAP